MTRKPDPGTFEHALKPVRVEVNRVFRLSTSPTTEPWFARAGSSRFDDPQGLHGTARFGMLYAADSVETAFGESVIHENTLFRHGRFELPKGAAERRQLVDFRRLGQPVLNLVDLTGPALKGLGLNADLLSGDDYTTSQEWAVAIHDAAPWADGLRYVSRQNPGGHCYAVFDRSALDLGSYAALPAGLVDSLCGLFNAVRV